MFAAAFLWSLPRLLHTIMLLLTYEVEGCSQLLRRGYFPFVYGTISNRLRWSQIGLLIAIKICCAAHKQCVILGWPISKLTQPELFPDSLPVLSCVKSRGSESRENRVDSAWRKFPRWVPSIATPLPLQIYGLTCAPRSGQTPLFHFLRLPRCRSNSGEANAGWLLNYERWAWVISVIKSKGAGPMPHGTMVMLCGCTLRRGLRMKFPASAPKLSKTSGI